MGMQVRTDEKAQPFGKTPTPTEQIVVTKPPENTAQTEARMSFYGVCAGATALVLVAATLAMCTVNFIEGQVAIECVKKTGFKSCKPQDSQPLK